MRPNTAVVVVAVVVVAGLMGACAKEPSGVDAGIVIAKPPIGTRQIERLQYNDVTDIYRVFLVGRPNPDEPERLQFLRLAHISDLDAQQGKKPFLKVESDGPVAYLPSTFNIGILHGFVEERPDAATGARAQVVTRTERHFWGPFGGKKILDGADPYASPAFYYPPPFHDGVLYGVGGTGASKDAAAVDYRKLNGASPQAVMLKEAGFATALQPSNADAGVAFQLPIVPTPIDQTTGLNNRAIGTVPGSPADLAKKKAAGKRNVKKKKSGR